jgi:hypothetical protein
VRRPGVQSLPVFNRRRDAMEDFVGTWDVEECTFRGKRTLKDLPALITITKNGNQYDVAIPLQGGNSKFFTASPNGQTISYKWTTVGKDRYRVQLVFDHTVNPAQIVEGPGGSTIERWGPNVVQPDDMGTITGQRVPPPNDR